MKYLYNYAIIVICVLIVMYIQYHVISENYVTQISNVDNKPYQVLNYDDSQLAADELALINDMGLLLTKFMLAKYTPDQYGYTLANRMKRKYRPDKLIENKGTGPDNTSYTTDKGKLVALCLREKETGEERIENYNTLVYVMVHEMSHIASIVPQHKPEFWYNFEIILGDAVRAGLYTPIDYRNTPVKYCSMVIDYSPLFDN